MPKLLKTRPLWRTTDGDILKSDFSCFESLPLNHQSTKPKKPSDPLSNKDPWKGLPASCSLFITHSLIHPSIIPLFRPMTFQFAKACMVNMHARSLCLALLFPLSANHFWAQQIIRVAFLYHRTYHKRTVGLCLFNQYIVTFDIYLSSPFKKIFTRFLFSVSPFSACQLK